MLQVIRNAINKVEEKYYVTINPTHRNGIETDYSRLILKLEQKFVFELYRLLRNSTESRAEIMEGEISKKILNNNYDRYPEIVDQLRVLEMTNTIKPDLIFHSGQQYNLKKDQVFVIECKVGYISPKAFYKDLFKIMLYDLVLNFQNSIWILVSISEKRVLELIEKYKAHNYFVLDDLKNIRIYLKEDFTKSIKLISI